MRNRFFIAIVAGLFFFSTGGVFLFAGEAGAETVTLRCWRCERTFEVAEGVTSGNCPNCDAPFVLPSAVRSTYGLGTESYGMGPESYGAAPESYGVPGTYGLPPTGPSASAPRADIPDLTPFQDAERFLGQSRTIQGRIVGTHLSARSGNLYLNYHEDFKRFVSIKIPADSLRNFPPNAAGFYNGKTVRATGRIVREGQVLRQEITDPANLTVVE